MCFFYFDRLKKRCIIISVGGIRLLSYAYKFYFYTFPPLYAKGAVARRLLLLLLKIWYNEANKRRTGSDA